MKLILLVAALSTSIIVQRSTVSYEGNWSLDAARSTSLPDYYSRVKSHKLDIVQTSTELRVDVTVDAGMPDPDRIALAYPLDGTELVTQTPIRGPGGLMQVPTKLKATLGADGSVHLTAARTIAMGGSAIEAVTTEDWTLSADRNTLTVHRIDDSPRGRVDAQMILARNATARP